MKRFSLLLTLVLAALATSCRTKDIRAIVIHLPEMRNQACCEIVLRALAGTQGLVSENPQIDMVHRTITVRYDSLLLSVKNIEFNIANAGFTANLIPANEEARKKLPPECLGDAAEAGLSSTNAVSVGMEDQPRIASPDGAGEPGR